MEEMPFTGKWPCFSAENFSPESKQARKRGSKQAGERASERVSERASKTQTQMQLQSSSSRAPVTGVSFRVVGGLRALWIRFL